MRKRPSPNGQTNSTSCASFINPSPPDLCAVRAKSGEPCLLYSAPERGEKYKPCMIVEGRGVFRQPIARFIPPSNISGQRVDCGPGTESYRFDETKEAGVSERRRNVLAETGRRRVKRAAKGPGSELPRPLGFECRLWSTRRGNRRKRASWAGQPYSQRPCRTRRSSARCP